MGPLFERPSIHTSGGAFLASLWRMGTSNQNGRCSKLLLPKPWLGAVVPHFEELLNLTNPPSMVELEDDGRSSFISVGEVNEVVKQLHSGKAPGVDEIRPEMLKALNVEGLSWLTRLINIAWKSGAVP